MLSGGKLCLSGGKIINQGQILFYQGENFLSIREIYWIGVKIGYEDEINFNQDKKCDLKRQSEKNFLRVEKLFSGGKC